MKKMLECYLYGRNTIYKFRNFSIQSGGYDLYFTIYHNNNIIFENLCNTLYCYDKNFKKYISIILDVFDYIDCIKLY